MRVLRASTISLALVLAFSGCSNAGPKISGEYAVEDMDIHTDFRPYDVDENIVSLPDPRYEVDGQGVRVNRHRSTNERIVHPVATAQYALDVLATYHRDSNPEHLKQAVANAEILWEHSQHENGAAWFPYPFDFALAGNPNNVIHDPWWSGMAQGQSLSLFSRLYEETGEDRWREAADQTFASFFAQKDEGGPWMTLIDEQGRLWFEEYAGDTEPLLVINGHIFAMYGLYDYYKVTDTPEAAHLFQAGATTIRLAFEEFRAPGEASYYCVQERCEDPQWQNEKYHMVHIGQLEAIGRITGEEDFLERAELLREDFVTDIPLR